MAPDHMLQKLGPMSHKSSTCSLYLLLGKKKIGGDALKSTQKEATE